MTLSREDFTEVTFQAFMFIMLFTLLFLNSCASPHDGVNGAPGPQGESCKVEALANGALITCGVSAVVVYNGSNGIDGKDLTPGQYSVSEVINPCGQQSAIEEVLLKLTNGQILGHYSEGGKQFLTLLGPGSYVTTDGNACLFQIDSNQQVRW